MKPTSFEYFSPKSCAEALKLLATYGGDGKIIAGGQSLVPTMNFRLARPSTLIDINEIDALDYMRAEDGVLRIGALTRHAAFHKPVIEGPLGGLLSLVVRNIAHYPIRQRGTFVGSLAHADPASEWCLVATTLNAQMVIAGQDGERIVEPAEFFQGLLTTAVGDDELLVEVRLPLLDPAWSYGFSEFSRRAGDFALAMSLAILRIVDGRIDDARLGLGAVSETPIRLADLERRLVGQTPSEALFLDVAETARDRIEPSSDIHASSEYRKDLIVAVIKRALRQAAA